MNVIRFCGLLASLPIIFSFSVASAQEPSSSPSFDVVSIRQVSSGAQRSNDQPDMEVRANGWRLNDESLFAAILNTYTPSVGNAAFYTVKQVQGVPSWAMDDLYVIDARIGESDLERWQNPATRADLLHSMMRSMLADRCKLAVHRELKEVAIYSLTLTKDGPQFSESVPGAKHPTGGPIPGGGEFIPSDGQGVMHFYGAPLSAVAGVLSNMMGRPVQDATGLSGKYDISLKMASLDSTVGSSGLSVSEVAKDLGLKLVPTKGQVEILVIDHIEKPSEN
ncbi:TIGR03435 family protein [Terriglobus sp. TAA 43]|uniref:TIGR03435 family protein n=1 Tax=Terriglobus sp. TAA 43 TaxID=278961 RepID=UPI0018DC9735|nr:TIGR03435 family protein [Terriglobus sp. TAA 43]